MKLSRILSRGDYLFLIFIVTALVVVSKVNFLLFHSLVEIAIISIGFLTFAFTWHLRRFELGYLLSIGILLGCSAIIAIFHLLTYKGMGVFPHNPNIPTQLWIASRYQFSFVILFASLFPLRSIHPQRLLATLLITSTTLITLVFLGHFPDCFIDGVGQTAFKIRSEYFISFILIISLGLFWKNRRIFPTHTSILIMAFFGFSILTELVFTSYLGVYDHSNMLGHIFHLIGSYLLYKATVETGLNNPFDLMFRNLNNAISARDEFISLASHELKTPLTPLKLQLQMFHREILKNPSTDPNDAKIIRMLQTSDQQIDRLNQLIDGMLDVSRLSTGKFEIFKEKTDLSLIIIELAKRHEAQILAVASKLTLNLTQVHANVDALRIEQVVTNLISNAIRYAPGTLVEIGVQEIANNRAMIWVTDTGPGISKEFIKKMFNRYERGIVSSSVGGLGLGLYISKEIIETHGGELMVESELGHGTKFIIILPTK